ncbi:MAG: basS [Devosia sp.]|nr:basS [Devosia sp.]
MFKLADLWRTTTVRLTATFVLIFVLFSVLLLGIISYQSSIQIQRQQTADIDREVAAIVQVDKNRGFRATIIAVDRLSRMPGPGIYFLGDPTGQRIVGNVETLPPEAITAPGVYSFDYDKSQPFGEDGGPRNKGNAVVRSVALDSGLLLVVGRDVVERRGYTAIIIQSFVIGVVGILVFSIIAGLFTAFRVLRRIDTINGTATKIMSGNLSERVPITGRKDEFDGLATSLNAMLDRIEQLMVGLKEVTDNVAHDLKTPLTRLRNKAENALRDTADPTSRTEALETTIAESDKLIRTFNALLLIARVEAGTPSGALTDLDLTTVVADVAELYLPVAEEEGLTLTTEIAEGVRHRGNRELLGQAVVNLVENALKYARVGDRPGHIVVGLQLAGERTLISVADNGPGIPEADRARVIERFVRLDESRSEAGSGLGLSLVAAVARLHRGELRLEDNAPGVRAVIDLPVD